MAAIAKWAAVCQRPLIIGIVPEAGGIPLLLNGFKGEKYIISTPLLIVSCFLITCTYYITIPHLLFMISFSLDIRSSDSSNYKQFFLTMINKCIFVSSVKSCTPMFLSAKICHCFSMDVDSQLFRSLFSILSTKL